ncbi:MAG: transglycosylase SLT domain-containing protein [Alphaproteobacteria bacterium]|nr:transglycosylase SLT domain-containing protein [Alphaproteobacteria bacterium]
MRSAQIRRSLVHLTAAFIISLLAAANASPVAAMASPRLKPPPPGPDYLSAGDYKALKDVESAIDRRDWPAEKFAAAAIQDEAARALAEWLSLYAGDPTFDFQDVGAFLDAHETWPALSKIQADAESRIPSDAPAQAVLDFFKKRDPATGEGKLALAQAQLDLGEKDAAALRIRNAWIHDDFRLADEQRILTRYDGFLKEEDHQARVDRLLFERKVTTARRVFSHLSPRHRRMAEARAALLVNASNGPSLFNALPQTDRLDSGVLLAAVRYYRRADEEPRAVELARLAPTDPNELRAPEQWWYERQLLMRWALKEKRYAQAYELAANNGLEPGGEFAEAEFDAGWIALRFLNSPERASLHFKALANAVGAPISLARAYYWLGRAAEANETAGLAGTFYAEAARFIYTYYGQLAAERIGAPAATQTFDPPVIPTAAERARFQARPLVRVMKMLADLGDDRALLIFGYRLDDQLDSPGEYVQLADLVKRRGATHIAVRAGKVAIGRGAFAADVAYPVIYVPDEATRFAPEELILGLSRQESEFNPRAYSRAGARGLMQLIPSTARSTARREGLTYRRAALLDDPVYNMIVGSAHLSELLDRYDGSFVMAIAAYNAGANNVDEWVRRYGDPRAPDVDPVDWVEQIPFAETRNYVQRVLENAEIYRARLTNAPIAGRLAADLERGGPSKRAGLLPNVRYADVLPPAPARTVRLANGTAGEPGLSNAAAGTIAADDAAADAEETANEETGAVEDEAASEKDEAAQIETDDDARGLSSAERADFIGDAQPHADPAPPAKRMNDQAARLSDTKALQAAPAAPAEDQAPPALFARGPSTPAETPPPPSLSPVAGGDCATYRDYIEASATMRASAADLNAGALARFSGAANDCKYDGAAAAAPAN